MPALILYRDLRAHHLRAVRESSMTSRQKYDARMATLACFHMRFGVASSLVPLLRLVARATRQTARLERWWGRGD
jgi:hypothetical protein